MAKRIARYLEKAVDACELYMRSVDRASTEEQRALYKEALRLVTNVAQRNHMLVKCAGEQIGEQAMKRIRKR